MYSRRRTTAKDIEEMFKPFGQIDKLDMKNGFAFIEYAHDREVDDAVKGIYICNKID